MKEVLIQSSLLFAHSENSTNFSTKALVLVIQLVAVVGILFFTLGNFYEYFGTPACTFAAWSFLGVAVVMIFGIFVSRLREVAQQIYGNDVDTFEKSLYVVFLGFNIFGKYIAYGLLIAVDVNDKGTQSAVYNIIDIITVLMTSSLHGSHARSNFAATQVGINCLFRRELTNVTASFGTKKEFREIYFACK